MSADRKKKVAKKATAKKKTKVAAANIGRGKGPLKNGKKTKKKKLA